MKPGHSLKDLNTTVMRKLPSCFIILLLCVTLPACLRHSDIDLGSDPTAAAYLALAGPGASIMPAAHLNVGGEPVSCGGRPAVLNPGLNDYAAAYPQFIVINPDLMAKVTKPVQLWIFYHECGHEIEGPDEAEADCYSVGRGKREHWLSAGGLDEVCAFIRPGKQDSMHFSGAERCEMMRACYAKGSN